MSNHLTPELLIRAYSVGLFPMAESHDDPTLYWIDPEWRGVIPLDGFHVPRSLRKVVRRGDFTIRVDANFSDTIAACAATTNTREETWINASIREAYCHLHEMGCAHSIEAWKDGELVGGYFLSHPEVDQVAMTTKENANHPANKHVGKTGAVLEEWYSYTANVRSKDGFDILLTIDESTYEGGDMGDDHPITWAHEYDGGRAFYTGLGHTFPADHPFLANQLIGGVEWAAGK